MAVPEKERAENRADFVQRLFAIAISVGISTTLARMNWIAEGQWPDSAECEELAILLTGVILMVSSWDGYLVSIYEKPLKNIWRFWTDILLVLVYMLFLLTAIHIQFFLPLLGIIFWIYFMWDILSILEYPEKYGSKSAEITFCGLIDIYWAGILDRPNFKRGPIITLVWAIYFTALWIGSNPMNHGQVFANCTFSILGLLLYRLDKNKVAADLSDSGRIIGHSGDNPSVVTGLRMSFRVIIMIALLGTAFLVRCLLSE